MSDTEYALQLMVEQFANRPGLFGLLRTSGKRHGWTAEAVATMEQAANYARHVLNNVDQHGGA